MLDDRLAKLSDVQKQCIRLSGEGRSSKEIAPLVGLTHQTVDQYLHRARQALGAANRREAARILSEIENGRTFKRFEFKPKAVVEEPDSAIPAGPTEQDERASGLPGLPPIGGKPNDLTPGARLVAISKIALFILICGLAMTLLLKGAFVALS
ncbi:helix-turn-helix domain-containing protein [Sphingobium agri]|uniref:Helix-turn-helix transcriptional regulator n=1 Tax=Sphingobium agri TaxID=2933566 RepID=A0ABT0DU69_9SPHN|nr:helix-turn-helix transcriptional regulator [Sphingobium agri]MCK0530666.1 helix-turn-helix transcriptional regulator [Sphingobium agri]